MVGEPRSATTMQKAIDQLEADAEAHSRNARQQRDLAKTKYALRDELLEWCRANGIPVKGPRDA